MHNRIKITGTIPVISQIREFLFELTGSFPVKCTHIFYEFEE